MRIAALGGAGVAVIALAFIAFSSGRPCGERADVEARVATISATLQADAAAGRITIEELSFRIKELNAAATAFESSKDLGVYCEALDKLGDEFAAR